MLLNENRNRVPQVAAAPVTGTTAGERGDMMMISAPGSPVNAKVYVCLVTGPVGPGSSVVWSTLSATEI